MKTDTIEIVDRGRGPQLTTTRITVLDIFYYLHRGHDFDFIQKVMPSLSREEFDVVVAYVNSHHDELVEKDRKAEELIRKGIEAQRARAEFSRNETIISRPSSVSPGPGRSRVKGRRRKTVKGILADVHVRGPVNDLVREMQAEPWAEFWKYLGLVLYHFDEGLKLTSTDLEIWQRCQAEQSPWKLPSV